LKNDTYEITSALRVAQNRAIAAYGGVGHGVYFYADKFVTYDGENWSAAANKVNHDLSQGLAIDVSDADFVADVKFTRLTGAATASKITIGTDDENKTISVYATGKISEN
jgi:hypothetical protein